jgi:hypothetical protein
MRSPRARGDGIGTNLGDCDVEISEEFVEFEIAWPIFVRKNGAIKFDEG